MAPIFFLTIIFVMKIATINSQDIYYPDDHLVIGNLRRREVIPLNPFYNHNFRRRFSGSETQNNLNYRKTKDIRDDVIDRRFELSESQLREAKLEDNKELNLDNIQNDFRWLSIDGDDGIGMGLDQQPNMVYIGQ